MRRAAEVLDSASLLLTTVTVLFGLWYSELQASIRIKIPLHLEDAQAEQRTVRSALYGRAVPLLVATLLIGMTFVPVVIGEGIRSWRNVAESGWRAIGDYDPSAIALFGVVALSGLLSEVLRRQIAELRQLHGKLHPSLPSGWHHEAPTPESK